MAFEHTNSLGSGKWIHILLSLVASKPPLCPAALLWGMLCGQDCPEVANKTQEALARLPARKDHSTGSMSVNCSPELFEA